MRILYLPIFEPGSYHERSRANKVGLRQAFERVGEVQEMDYLAIPQDELFLQVLKACETFKPTLIFTQIQGPDRFTPEDLRHIKIFADCPLVNWNGDYSPQSMISPEMLNLLQHVDLQLVTNGSVIKTLVMARVKAHMWLHSFEPAIRDLPDVQAHDVVFLGNNYSDHRAELYKVLRALPCNVGIYGNGWPQSEGENTYDFTTGKALYRKAKICISDNEYTDAVGYLSNRPFQAMAAGCLVLQQNVERITDYTRWIGGLHYWHYKRLDELPDLVDYFLNNEEHRIEVAQTGAAWTRLHHNFDARVAELFNLLDRAKLEYR